MTRSDSRRYTSEDVHRALFAKPPKPRTLAELKEGVWRYVKGRYARLDINVLVRLVKRDDAKQVDEVRKAYNAWVHQYDTNANSTRDLNAKVLCQQPFDLAGKAVLEIGCGTGFNTIWLADRAQCVVGVDLSEGMLRKARRRLGERNVHLLQADITKPWPLGQGFDVLVVTLVLEHVKDLAHVFAEARPVLRPDGLLYVGELHPYKQLRGVQAKYRDAETGAEVLVPAFRHSVSEYINTGIEAGFTLLHMGEWQADADTDLQLLTLLFERR